MSTQTQTSSPTSDIFLWTIDAADNKNSDGGQVSRKQKTKELDLSQSEDTDTDRDRNTERTYLRCSGMCFGDYFSYFFANFVLTLGMVTFMALYILVGAYVFLGIEQDAEMKSLNREREEHIEMESNVTNSLILWMTHGGGCNTSRKDMESEVRSVLHAYTESVWKNQWRGQVPDDKAEIGVEHLNWQLLPAYIFCMSIVTTIGYGNLSPKTSLGQIVTIIYAIIGIPCTAVCLSTLGSMAGTFVKFTLYKARTCRGDDAADGTPRGDHNAGDTFLAGAGQSSHPPKRITFSESNSNQTNNSVKFNRFSFRSSSSAPMSSQQDQDDRSDGNSLGSSVSGALLAVGSCKKTPPAVGTLCPTQEEDAPREETPAISAKEKNRSTSTTSIFSKKHLKRQTSRTSLAMVMSMLDGDVVDRDAVNDVEVPVYVSVVLIITYVLIGGVIFSEWKGRRWDFLIGFYFSFVTLSTIGLGDYVFGDNSREGEMLLNNTQLLFTVLYIFFGLGLVSMCIDLMHKSISRTLTRINLGFWDRMDRYSKENRHRQRELRRLRAKLEDANRARKTAHNDHRNAKD